MAINASLGEDGGNHTADPLWVVILQYLQVLPTTTGVVANTITFIIFHQKKDRFSAAILIILKHQSVIDALVCLNVMVICLQPAITLTGRYIIDVMICHFWFNQLTYWGLVTLSAWSLVLVAVERYMAVCKPLQHYKITTTRNMTLMFGFIYLLVIPLLCIIGLEVSIKDSVCTNDFLVDGPVFAYGITIVWLLIFYIIPLFLFIMFYTLILLSLKRRQGNPALAHCRTIETANKQLIRTSTVVTIFFVIFMGYDTCVFVLSVMDIGHYSYNTPFQTIGVFLAGVNSAVNPFVYAWSLPVFRKCLWQTLTCKKETSNSNPVQHLHRIIQTSTV